jgi:hypothetical protein
MNFVSDSSRVLAFILNLYEERVLDADKFEMLLAFAFCTLHFMYRPRQITNLYNLTKNCHDIPLFVFGGFCATKNCI